VFVYAATTTSHVPALWSSTVQSWVYGVLKRNRLQTLNWGAESPSSETREDSRQDSPLTNSVCTVDDVLPATCGLRTTYGHKKDLSNQSHPNIKDGFFHIPFFPLKNATSAKTKWVKRLGPQKELEALR